MNAICVKNLISYQPGISYLIHCSDVKIKHLLVYSKNIGAIWRTTLCRDNS